MLPEEIRRAAKEKAVDSEILARFERQRNDMLDSFAGLSPMQRLEELGKLLVLLGVRC